MGSAHSSSERRRQIPTLIYDRPPHPAIRRPSTTIGSELTHVAARNPNSHGNPFQEDPYSSDTDPDLDIPLSDLEPAKSLSHLPSRASLLSKMATTTGPGLECSIDLEVYPAARKTSCGHFFCTECITIWFKTSHTCPMCREDLYDPAKSLPQSYESYESRLAAMRAEMRRQREEQDREWVEELYRRERRERERREQERLERIEEAARREVRAIMGTDWAEESPYEVRMVEEMELVQLLDVLDY